MRYEGHKMLLLLFISVTVGAAFIPVKAQTDPGIRHLEKACTSHFIPVSPTGRTQPVYFTNAMLDGKQLEAGDEIGIYDGTLCAGACTVSSFPMADPVIVYLQYSPPGEDPLPGAEDGHSMMFKVWDQSADEETEATASVVSGSAVFSEGSITAVSLTADTRLFVEVKVFLEGPYSAAGDTMATILCPDSMDVIPLTSPHAEDARTVTFIPSGITDWVLVQLRTSKTGSAVASHSAFLRRDGRIVADDGETAYITLETDPGNYFIVVQHRNHLAVMSDEVHTLSIGSSTLYDFTTGEDKLEGGDAAPLETGVWGMYAGDANHNQQVQNDDKNDYWKVQVGLAGYRGADFSLNGQVQNDDKNDIWKLNVGLGSYVPGL